MKILSWTKATPLIAAVGTLLLGTATTPAHAEPSNPTPSHPCTTIIDRQPRLDLPDVATAYCAADGTAYLYQLGAACKKTTAIQGTYTTRVVSAWTAPGSSVSVDCGIGISTVLYTFMNFR